MATTQGLKQAVTRILPDEGSFSVTSNGTIMINRDYASIMAGCREVCTGAVQQLTNSPQQSQPQAQQQPAKKKPLSGAQKRHIKELAEKNRQRAAAKQQPKAK